MYIILVKMLAVDIKNTPFYKLEMERAVKKENFESAMLMMEKFNHSIDDIVKAFNLKKKNF